MKRLLSCCALCVLCLTIYLLSLSACNRASDQYPWPIGEENTFTLVTEGVVMTLVEDSLSPNSAEFLVVNDTDDKLMFGEQYYIQIEISGKWREIEWHNTEELQGKSISWTLIGYEIRAHEERIFDTDWSFLYQSLPPGQYRFVKNYMIFRDDGVRLTMDDYQYVACPFTIE